MFLKSKRPNGGAESDLSKSTPSFPRGAQLVGLAVSLLLAACTPGDESSPGPQVSGGQIAAEGAHEHSAARMGLAVDGERLTLDLLVPGHAIFGFEHAAGTDEERAAVTAAMTRLRSDAGSILALDSTLGCTVDGVEILDAPELDGEEGEGHEPDGWDPDDHDEEGHDEDEGHDDEAHDDEAHDDEAHDDEAHDDEAHDDDDDGHSEVRARVTWSCTTSPEGSPGRLQVARLLPEVEFIDLTVITSAGQAAARVSADADFRF